MRIILIILCLLLSNILLSDEIDSLKTNLRYYDLEGIRVIADKPQETVGAIDIIEFDSNVTIPDLSISDVVKNIVGLHISTGGKQGSSLKIRGFDNDQIKIMLDGRPLGGGYFGNVDLSTIPVSDIKEIRVLKGPVSSLYGSDTMGGVVNILTDSPNNDSWIKAGTEFKRNNTNKTFISSARDLGEWDYWLYTSHYQTDGFVLSKDFVPTISENGDTRDQSARNQWDIQSKLNFTILDFHSIGFQAGYTFMDKKEIPSSIYENRVREFIDWKRYQFSSLASLQLKYNLKSNLNLYYDRYDDIYAEFNPETHEMYSQWPSELKSWILGINQTFDWDINDHLDSSFGYRFEKESYSRKDNGEYLSWFGRDQFKHNMFYQMEYILKSINITVGSGISFFKQNERKNWISHVEPSAGVYFQNSLNWRYSLSFSSNTKYPTMHQLFSSSSGNSELIQERAQKSEFDLLIPYSFNCVSGSIRQAIFYNHISNLIEKVGGFYTNIDQINSYGYELSCKLIFLWEHQIDYSYLKFSDKSSKVLLEAPNNSISITETIKLPKTFQVDYKTTWIDIRLTEENTILPSYWLHSVYINKIIKRYKILLGIENIFDLDYQEEYGYPAEGRNFILSLEGSFF